MEDKYIQLESSHVDEKDSSYASSNHGWQRVTYAKKQRKKPVNVVDVGKVVVSNGSAISGGDNVFKSLEKQSEERRRRIEAQRLAIYTNSDAPMKLSKHRSDDQGNDSYADADGIVLENVAVNVKIPKVKKPKKPKVTVAEAAAKLDAVDLESFLAEVTASYHSQQDIQLMRFADYFGRAFSAVIASQFPWLKLFRENTVAKLVDVPVSHISEAVYKTSVDWINQRSYEALASFVLWSLDSIFSDLANQQAGTKGSKKIVQQTASKSQVAIFLVLAMVLRRKPDVLVILLPVLKDSHKYQGQDKLPVIVWMIAQASQGDLAVGLYLWAHHVLPIVGGKSGSNPRTRDLVLQLVERILSAPKARTILVNGAVRKGERLMPSSALDLLLRVTFPTSSARVKATDRFESIYPILKEVALGGSPGSKAMKQVSQQILAVVVKAAGEGNDSLKNAEKIYMDNLEASVVVLRKLNDQWKELSAIRSSLEAFGETLKSFRHKNEKALAEGEDAAHEALLKNADKYTKALLGRVSRGHGCVKASAIIMILVAMGAVVMFPNMESWDWNKLSVLFNSQSF